MLSIALGMINRPLTIECHGKKYLIFLRCQLDDNPGRFFDDDGNEIDPNLVPKPGLCLTCRNDDIPSEYVLCILTRADQQDEEKFICFGYEAK